MCVFVSLRICFNLKQKRYHQTLENNAYIKGTKNWYFLRDLISRRRQHELDASISCWSLDSTWLLFSYTWCDCWFIIIHFDFGLFGWLIGRKWNKSLSKFMHAFNWYVFRFEMLSIRHRDEVKKWFDFSIISSKVSVSIWIRMEWFVFDWGIYWFVLSYSCIKFSITTMLKCGQFK